ncbi:haloacid dehalogenase type II [Brevibacterium album]|uniref:haloacid dehalogenase type II n=1 Tax=Brevibacterium album TaxID=417948 RepID=UPI0004250B68|nr:haloacid dehalogenase type II [Brevibacterium album]
MSADDIRDVKAVMFDFYGTVVDMQGSLTKAITPYLEKKGYTENPAGRVVTWWRRTHFENSMIDALLHRDHTPYKQIGFEAVDYTLERAGIEHTDDEVRALVQEITRLDPFPEVVEALRSMKDQGLKLYILSNGDPDMLAAGVPFSGTGDLWDRVMSVSEADSFKPHRDTYQTAVSLVGLGRQDVLFVANHAFDCIGAKAAGLRSAFIDRRKRPFGNSRYEADVTVSHMGELADLLARSAPATE